MSVDWEKGKEKLVHEELYDEKDEFINDFVLVVDPVATVQKVLHDLVRRLKQLASTQPQTPEIQ